MMANFDMIISGIWLGIMYLRTQEYRNKKSWDLEKNGEGIIYLKVNCVKWKKNLLEFKDKVT